LVSSIFLSLLVRQFETLDERRLRMFLRAHDANHFVEIQVRNQQAIEDVQPRPTASPAGDSSAA